MLREEIEKLIEKSIKELQKKKTFPVFELPKTKIEHPEDKRYGDYSTNVAMQVSKSIKKSPMEIAELLTSKLRVIDSSFLGRVEAAKPGFINFFLKKEYLQKEIKRILKEGEKFGQLKIGKPRRNASGILRGRNKKIHPPKFSRRKLRRVQVEFISANPTGPLTVGNARGGPLGDVLGNVLKKAGFKVEKAYYINDYGMQILTLGHSVLKDSEAKYKGAYVDDVRKQMKRKDLYPVGSSRDDSFRAYKAGEKASRILIKMIKQTVDRMGIKYDEWISEKKLHKSNAVKKALEFLKKKKLIYEKEGALWFNSSKFGDERDRVVVKSDGWKTYLAGDIALHQCKFKNKKFDKVINIWGADHYGDVPGLQAGITALGFKGKLDIILLQFVTLFEKGREIKMSKRLGTFVTMDELLDMVGVDVVRFFFLQKSASTHLNFDLELAKEQSEENPVYYIQYANARIHSILARSKSLLSTQSRNQKSKINFKLLNYPSELNLVKQLIRLPEIVEDTAKDYQVQRIPQYALDLAVAFHRFYRDCRVLSEDKKLTQSRLSLVFASKIILRNTLDLMGISAPEKM
jgi:arginyl-tRNA synthetase